MSLFSRLSGLAKLDFRKVRTTFDYSVRQTKDIRKAFLNSAVSAVLPAEFFYNFFAKYSFRKP